MYFTYIIRSEQDGTYYIGSCTILERRLHEHNFSSKGYTKFRRPWSLIYKEEHLTKSEAIKREKYLKRLKSRVALEKIIGLVGP